MGFAQQLEKLSSQPIEEQKLICDGLTAMKYFTQSLRLKSNKPKPEEQAKTQAKGREIGM